MRILSFLTAALLIQSLLLLPALTVSGCSSENASSQGVAPVQSGSTGPIPTGAAFHGLVAPSDSGGLGGPTGKVYTYEGVAFVGQCVEAARLFVASICGYSIPPLGSNGGAELLWLDPTKRPDPAHMIRLPNSPGFVPEKGFMGVMGAWSGNPYGHVFIVVSADANARTIRVVDSNWVGTLSGGEHDLDLDDPRILGYYKCKKGVSVSTLSTFTDQVFDVDVVDTNRVVVTTRGDVTGATRGAVWIVNLSNGVKTKIYEAFLMGGCSFDAKTNTVVVSVTGEHRVVRVSLTGTTVTPVAGTGAPGQSPDGTSALAATFNQPQDVLVDNKTNRIIVVDTGNHQVRFVSGGILGTLAGNGSPGADGNGGAPELARVTFPGQIVSPQTGIYFFVDGGNRVRRIGGGTITTIPATFSKGLQGLTFVNSDLTFASQNGSHVGQLIGSTIFNLAGKEGEPGDADGPSTSARFREPFGVAFGNGKLFVADARNKKLRVITGL